MWFSIRTEVLSIPAMNSERGWTELPLFSRFPKRGILMITLWLKLSSNFWNLRKLTAVPIALLMNCNCLFLNIFTFTISIALILLITFYHLSISRIAFNLFCSFVYFFDYGPRVEPAGELAHPVRVHRQIGDRLLDGQRRPAVSPSGAVFAFCLSQSHPPFSQRPAR